MKVIVSLTALGALTLIVGTANAQSVSIDPAVTTVTYHSNPYAGGHTIRVNVSGSVTPPASAVALAQNLSTGYIHPSEIDQYTGALKRVGVAWDYNGAPATSGNLTFSNGKATLRNAPFTSGGNCNLFVLGGGHYAPPPYGSGATWSAEGSRHIAVN